MVVDVEKITLKKNGTTLAKARNRNNHKVDRSPMDGKSISHNLIISIQNVHSNNSHYDNTTGVKGENGGVWLVERPPNDIELDKIW